MPSKGPSGAKAEVDFYGTYGAAEAAPFKNKIKVVAGAAAPGNRQNWAKARAEKGDFFAALKRCATQSQSSLANFIAGREPFKGRAIHRMPPNRFAGRRSTGGWSDRGPRPALELLMKACQ